MRPVQCDERRCTNPATHETTLIGSPATVLGEQPAVLWARLCDEHELTDDDQIVRVSRP